MCLDINDLIVAGSYEESLDSFLDGIPGFNGCPLLSCEPLARKPAAGASTFQEGSPFRAAAYASPVTIEATIDPAELASARSTFWTENSPSLCPPFSPLAVSLEPRWSPSCFPLFSPSPEAEDDLAPVAPTTSSSARGSPSAASLASVQAPRTTTSARPVAAAPAAPAAPSAGITTTTTTGAATPSKKVSSWADAEKAAATTLMVVVCDDKHFAGTERRFEEVSRRLAADYGFHRSPPAVKLAWNRYLRQDSGFEDRGDKKRSAGLVTSALGVTKTAAAATATAATTTTTTVAAVGANPTGTGARSEAPATTTGVLKKAATKKRKAVEMEETDQIRADEALARRLQAEFMTTRSRHRKE